MSTVLLEVSIDLGLLKKSLLKTSKIVLMFSNSFARHFSSMVYAKCLLPRLDRLLLVRSCLQNFYQCCYGYSLEFGEPLKSVKGTTLDDKSGHLLMWWHNANSKISATWRLLNLHCLTMLEGGPLLQSDVVPFTAFEGSPHSNVYLLQAYTWNLYSVAKSSKKKEKEWKSTIYRVILKSMILFYT